MKAILTPQPPPVNEKFSLNLTYLLIIYAFPYFYHSSDHRCIHVLTMSTINNYLYYEVVYFIKDRQDK